MILCASNAVGLLMMMKRQKAFAILSLMRMNISDFCKAARIKPAVISARMAENMK